MGRLMPDDEDEELLPFARARLMLASAFLTFAPTDCDKLGYASASGCAGPPPPPAVWAKPSLPAATEAQGATLAFAGGAGVLPRLDTVGATGGAFGAPDPAAFPPRGADCDAGRRLGAMLVAMAWHGGRAARVNCARGRRTCDRGARTHGSNTAAGPAHGLGQEAAMACRCCMTYLWWNC